MIRKFPVSYCLFVLMLAVAVIAASVSGYVQFVSAKKNAAESLSKRLRSDMSGCIEHFAHEYSTGIERTLADIESSSGLDRLLSSPAEESIIYLIDEEKKFQWLAKQTPGCVSISFIGRDGKEVISVSKDRKSRNLVSIFEPGDKYYKRAAEIFSKIKIMPPGTVLFDTPFEKNGSTEFITGMAKSDPEVGGFAGVIIMRMNLSIYASYLSSKKESGDSMLWLFDAEGGTILAPENRTVSPDPSPFIFGNNRGLVNDMVFSGDIMAGKPEQIFLKVAFSASPKIFSSLTASIVKNTLVVILLALAISSLISYFASRWLARPIINLADACKGIGKGDFSGKIPRVAGREMQELADSFNQMSENLRSMTVSKDIYQREKDRAQNYLDIAEIMLVALDCKGKVSMINRKGCEILGYPEGDIIGKTWFDFFPENSKLDAQQTFSKLLGKETEHVKYVENSILSRGGEGKIMAWHNAVLSDKDDNVIGTLSSGEDITERKRAEGQLQKQGWLKTGIVQLSQVMSGDPEISILSSKVISEISTYVDARIGTIYLAGIGDATTFTLAGSYAYKKPKDMPDVFGMGEGLVGQVALEKRQILLRNVPEDYIKISSGTGERVPKFICVTPFICDGRVKGVIEVGTFNEMTEQQMEYLNQAMPPLALAIESAETRMRLAKSLAESKSLTEELRSQQEELRTSNDELEEQTKVVKASEEKLKIQQEELQVTNEELEEKNDLLDRQKNDVEKARSDIEKKAEELAMASKYKSEFLANMSHELRTPLNSLLILSQSLQDNREGNLTADQVESARIIQSGGNDLLTLINEILDLSKIEAGRMSIQLGTMRINDLADAVRTSFTHMTDKKGLTLEVVVSKDAPHDIMSDRKRIEQIIRNLMSNAIKFTDSGGVTVTFASTSPDTDLSRSGLSANESLAIEVKDTGIGIAPENQKIIFEAFQQVDGGAARKYGGTGLGLSISKELSRILGGEIKVKSELGKGTTFTLYLPVVASTECKVAPPEAAKITIDRDYGNGAARNTMRQSAAAVQIEDDRDNLKKDDKIILVVEDDSNFARMLYKKCHEKDFKCLLAPTGEAGLELAVKYLPSAVLLDICLPGMDGWAVLTSLKENMSTRHIPVHIVSVEDSSAESVRKGAVGHATKPIRKEDLEQAFHKFETVLNEKSRCVLVVDGNVETRRKTINMIGEDDIRVDEAENAKQAMDALRSGHYDCVVLDLSLPDMDGLELLKRLDRECIKLPPVIVYTSRILTREEEIKIREHAESIVIKDVRSQERLLDEVSLFLHLMVSKMPEKQRKIIRNLHSTDEILKDKKVLVVDDDMRTSFAMSRILSESGMNTLKAENGERALRLLEEHPDVDIVLMDIMMPVMDGYEAMKRIRSQEKLRDLPIIVLTAKAMPEDREKCLAAGANDYLAKPVDQKRLISMMRVWLCR